MKEERTETKMPEKTNDHVMQTSPTTSGKEPLEMEHHLAGTVRVEFPLLDDYDALRFAGLLKHILDALWEVHGEGMAKLLEQQATHKTRFWERTLPKRPAKSWTSEELRLLDQLF